MSTSPAKGKASAAKGAKALPSNIPTKANANHITMIVQAIVAMNERGGVSRQAVWKYMTMQFPEATTNERS